MLLFLLRTEHLLLWMILYHTWAAVALIIHFKSHLHVPFSIASQGGVSEVMAYFVHQSKHLSNRRLEDSRLLISSRASISTFLPKPFPKIHSPQPT